MKKTKLNKIITITAEKLLLEWGPFQFLKLGDEMVCVKKNKKVNNDFITSSPNPVIDMIFFDSKSKNNYGSSAHCRISQKDMDNFVRSYQKRKRMFAKDKDGVFFCHLSPDISFIINKL